MAHDDALAQRIRELIGTRPDVTEMKMFGGLAFLVAGNLAVAASNSGGLMVRVSPGDPEELAARPYAEPFEMRGRPVDGWLRVAARGVETSAGLEPWVEAGVAYAESLPAKD